MAKIENKGYYLFTMASLNYAGWPSHMSREGIRVPTDEDLCCHSLVLFQVQDVGREEECQLQNHADTSN